MKILQKYFLFFLAVLLAQVSPTKAVAQDANPIIGAGDGLLESCYLNRHLSGPAATNLVVGAIDFDEGAFINQGLPRTNQFGATWMGELQAQYSEPYTLYLESSGGGRVWLNEQLLVDDWQWHTDHEASVTINLTAAQHYLIRVEYFENYGTANVKLSWSSPSTPKEVIPQSQLYSHPVCLRGRLKNGWKLKVNLVWVSVICQFWLISIMGRRTL